MRYLAYALQDQVQCIKDVLPEIRLLLLGLIRFPLKRVNLFWDFFRTYSENKTFIQSLKTHSDAQDFLRFIWTVWKLVKTYLEAFQADT